MNQAGLELLKRSEGFRSEAYDDGTGVITIGWGFTEGVKRGDTITPAQAEQRLQVEVERFEQGVKALCTREPNENELAAMTSLAYNVGLSAFKGSTVLRLHNAGDYAGASKAFDLWNKAGGQVLAGLVKRRRAEGILYLTPPGAAVPAIMPAPAVDPVLARGAEETFVAVLRDLIRAVVREEMSRG